MRIKVRKGSLYKRCIKCGSKKDLTKHHILPKRHFGATNNTVVLCRDCHDRLEILIPYEFVPLHEYFYILGQYLEV